MPKIKLIIFDLGGVLSNPEGKEEDPFSIVAEKYDLALDEFMDYFYKFFKEYHFKRTLSQHTFWKKTLREIDSEISEKDVEWVIDIFNEKAVHDASEEMLSLVKKLSKKYKLAILSNTYRDVNRPLFSSNFIKYFDGIYLSHMNVKKKPSREAYARVMNDFDLEPRECIFIDDKLKNVKGARRLNLNAIHFKGHENLVKELEKLLSCQLL